MVSKLVDFSSVQFCTSGKSHAKVGGGKTNDQCCQFGDLLRGPSLMGCVVLGAPWERLWGASWNGVWAPLWSKGFVSQRRPSRTPTEPRLDPPKSIKQLQDALVIISKVWDFCSVQLHRVECNMKQMHNLRSKCDKAPACPCPNPDHDGPILVSNMCPFCLTAQWGSSAPAALVKCLITI
jgi:hypothetical protein